MQMQKRKQKGLKVSDFAFILVVFKWHHGSEGVNGLLIGRDKVTRQCPAQTIAFEERGTTAKVELNQGSSAHQPNTLPLGQTSSRC